MDYQKLANLLFPDVTETQDDLEKRFPPRDLPEGARVTRFAPSPTGFLHIGGVFGALTDIMIARASKGVAYLRIEDTDKKREIDDGVSAIIAGFDAFGLHFDEGVTGFGTEQGDYGPYTQSRRKEIYHVVAKSLVEKGMAYPCFCTAEELTKLREQQEADGALIRGYFGKYARCRDLTMEQIEANLAAGKSWVLRFRSDGSEDRRITFDDLIRGKIEMPENIIDEVLLKSDGIPTYHFAHVCDDHFMRTTHVVRAEEWLSSVPKHIALFKACGYRVPKYVHTAQVMKLDEQTGDKRKLSKRKDPEAAVSYFVETGFPREALIEYLLTLLNSNFEDWRRANPNADAMDFPFNVRKMSNSGCLFDLQKLNDVSKNVISHMKAETVYERVAAWAKQYDPEFHAIFTADPAFSTAILNIDRENPKPRKDIARWDEVPAYLDYFFHEPVLDPALLPARISRADAKAILTAYADSYDPSEDKDAWFARIKAMCPAFGCCPEVREYKKNPEGWKGHAGDVSTVIRLAATGRTNTPDLCTVIRLLGREKAVARFLAAASAL
ncbi:MAG: glutamate--tRNA ligase [Oscillospiraceae bacterium]|nr:glutamate--tRNA ligase [Oscillospiraceae bacterium]